MRRRERVSKLLAYTIPVSAKPARKVAEAAVEGDERTRRVMPALF